MNRDGLGWNSTKLNKMDIYFSMYTENMEPHIPPKWLSPHTKNRKTKWIDFRIFSSCRHCYSCVRTISNFNSCGWGFSIIWPLYNYNFRITVIWIYDTDIQLVIQKGTMFLLGRYPWTFCNVVPCVVRHDNATEEYCQNPT